MFHFPAFPPRTLYIQARVTTLDGGGVSPSDILGSTPVYRLPEAYRRFPRPSSAPDAKASTMRSHTLTTPKGPASCAREMFQTHSYLMTRKITLHKQHSRVVDARVHYT